MAYPTLSRRHVATPMHCCKRRPRPRPSTSDSKVSSPVKCSRSESLRSTWMTSGSDSLEEEQEPEADDCTELQLQLFAPLQRPLSDWVYWQRDAVALPDCWTRVFAVFCGNLLWLYRYEDASAKSLLVRMRVTTIDADNRQLQFRDAATTASVLLYMADAPAFDRWHSHVTAALAEFPPVQERDEQQRARQRAVASAVQKQSFWKVLAAAMVLGAKTHQVEETAKVQHDRKSLSQHWKSVTTTLRGALKLSKKKPQLTL
ncbi:hypothetical protein PF005_g27934 [Phytophthora fragariae]|uniref:Uncharacterized protein n=1 Tax=Phytophthora fragariae TaxID=53985 RepID=A0A6A3DL76_9STRA|nr:hypothetical protein PF003_g3112 [Phytophthora fragariae]KAE8922089.1 hypothetical protein PF009_g27637 [Phytophthora fragariae]KAE8971032.1 hypothetical protein PF011_g26188 [Phytophthora fragariae]KAE9067156.1 hypothetical protein PF010_g27581 [Phytophthora fragariae]KAE9067692.1 hypothetical protein PF007_g27974 [Phytophthora fragariae]